VVGGLKMRAQDACSRCVLKMRAQDACSRCVLKMRAQDACSRCVLKISPAGEFCLFSRGPFFSFRAIFRGFSQFRGFSGTDFSLFRFSSKFGTRYTRKLISRLYYCPSENCFKAGQLGPKGSRFVQTVDWGLNPWFSLLESSVSTRRTC
jgi:hypothetical protein